MVENDHTLIFKAQKQIIDTLAAENARLRRQLENVSALVPYWQRHIDECKFTGTDVMFAINAKRTCLQDLRDALQAGEDAARPEQAEGGRE